MSGNPGGREKGTERMLREQFGKDVPAMVGVLVDLALGRDVVGYEDVDPNGRIKCAALALDRITGKAKEHVEISGELSPIDSALLSALHMTPQERRNKLAEIDAEDQAALDTGPPMSDDD